MKVSTAGLKQSDIAVIILVMAIAMTVAYFIGSSLINTSQSRSVRVEEVVPISSEIPVPDPKIYAEGYINPAEDIEVGNSNNQKPFGQAN